MDRREKQYVEVVAAISPNGRVTPMEIIWPDGRRFPVDRVLERRRAESGILHVRGYRYTIYTCGRRRFLWRDDDGRFFVERIVRRHESSPGS